MKRILAILILIGILAAALVYNLWARSAPPAALPPSSAAQREAVSVTVASVHRVAQRETLTLVGALRADQRAAIGAKVPGRILEILVREGDRVRRGQPLVRLDIGDAQAQVTGARAGVTAAEAQSRKAVDGKRARTVELDAKIADARSGLKTALAKLRQAELGVRLTGSAAASDRERAEAGVRQAEAGLQQAEAGLKQAEDTLRDLEFLYSRGGIPRIEVEGARTQARVARAKRQEAVAGLEQAQAALRPLQETASLRTQTSQADVEAAQAGVQQAQDGLQNALRAGTEALRLADRDIEAARADVLRAQAGLQQVEAQVGNGTLISPLDGLVTDLNANVGEFAQPGMPLMRVVSPGSVYLEAGAPARYTPHLQRGLRARVTVDTFPNRLLAGEVTDILPVGADGRSVPVHIRLSVGGLRLTPGAGAKAVLELPPDTAGLSIPLDALHSEGDVTYVYVAANGVAERRDITVGEMEGPRIRALSGLAEGERVIVSAPLSLQPGMPVRVAQP